MVKLKGPQFAGTAAGSFGDILTYSDNHRRKSARKKTKPRVTRTAKQNGIRRMMTFLSKQWAVLSQADWQTWSTPAEETSVANYHAFISYNMKRWRNWNPPTQQWPADETQPAPTVLKPWRFIQWHALKLQISAVGDATTWGYLMHQDPNSLFVPAFGNLFGIQPNRIAQAEFPYYAPINPPFTHVKIRPFGFTGVWGNIPNPLFVPVS